MTAVDHAELKRLAEGATPGPWTYRDMRPNTYGPAFVDASDVQSLAICGDAVGRSDTHGFCLQVDADVRMANAAFIAAANPAVVFALLSEIEGLKADRDEARAGRSIIAGGSMDMAVMYASANERADAAEAALRTQAPDSWRPDREAVARIVDPAAFLFTQDELMKGDPSQFNALSKADRIIAALRARTSEPEAGGEAEHWRERALSAEASMLTLRRIEDAKVFCYIETSDIWSVHVRGPDETVAAKSYADAVSYCDKLNAECPDARAVPILSPHKGNPVVLSAYDVACYEYPAAMDAPLRDAFARGAMYASHAPATADKLPEDVSRLVLAARAVAFGPDGGTSDEINELDKASEAFASRVSWDDEPDAALRPQTAESGK